MQGELNPEGWMKKHRFYQVRREKKHLGRRGRASTRGQGLYPGLCGWSRAGGKAGSPRTLQSGDRLRKAPLGPCRFAGLGWSPGRCVPEKLPGAAQAAGPCTTLGVALHWWCSGSSKPRTLPSGGVSHRTGRNGRVACFDRVAFTGQGAFPTGSRVTLARHITSEPQCLCL